MANETPLSDAEQRLANVDEEIDELEQEVGDLERQIDSNEVQLVQLRLNRDKILAIIYPESGQAVPHG